jgi:hypothetical protein
MKDKGDREGALALIFVGKYAESRAWPLLIFVGVKLVFFGKFTDICRGDRQIAFTAKTVP